MIIIIIITIFQYIPKMLDGGASIALSRIIKWRQKNYEENSKH